MFGIRIEVKKFGNYLNETNSKIIYCTILNTKNVIVNIYLVVNCRILLIYC